MTYDDAAFLFFGWNKDMGRKTPQLIVVRLGQNADMRIAVVRRMIAIIREYTQEDFYWRSVRHDGGLVLSAPHRVDRLYVGGEEVVSDGRLVQADEEEIARHHRDEARRFAP